MVRKPCWLGNEEGIFLAGNEIIEPLAFSAIFFFGFNKWPREYWCLLQYANGSFFFALWTISSYFWLKRMPWRNSVSQYRTCRITLRQPLESCFNGSLLPWLRICLFRIFFCIIASAFSVCLNCTFISRTRCGKLTRTAAHVCPLRQSAYLKDATSVLLWKMRVFFSPQTVLSQQRQNRYTVRNRNG